MTRDLSEFERTVILKVAELLPSDRREQLIRDVTHAVAEPVTADGGIRVVFHLSGYERPPYRGQHSFGVEGELLDRDGAALALDVYADENDRLLELEIVRWIGGPLKDPDLSTLKLY